MSPKMNLNKCPDCKKLHAFSIMGLEEAQLYSEKPLPQHDDGEPDEYRIYICPEQEERVVVLIER